MGTIKTLTDDELYSRWQERFERVAVELKFLFSVRRKFRDVQRMFETNKRLHAMGSQAWEWLLLLWGRDTVMAVRRELDDDSNTISLGRLLDEMAARPEVMTRRRYMEHMKVVDAHLVRLNDEHFTALGIVASSRGSDSDHLDPAAIRAERVGMNAAAKPVLEYGNRLVAHRTPVETLGMTVQNLHDALDAMEPVVQKYHVLLTGSALVNIEPVEVGDDWKDAFSFAWYEGRSRG